VADEFRAIVAVVVAAVVVFDLSFVVDSNRDGCLFDL